MSKAAKVSLAVIPILGLIWASLVYTERTRAIEGVLLYQFEGANFFEDANAQTVRQLQKGDAGWLNTDGHERFESALQDDYDASGCWRVTAIELKFVGRRRLGPAGHLGAWWSEYEIDEMIEAKPVQWPDCDSPYDWERNGD